MGPSLCYIQLNNGPFIMLYLIKQMNLKRRTLINLITNPHTSYRLNLFLWSLTIVFAIVQTHQIQEISLPHQNIFGLTNRMIPIPMQPNVTRLFSASTIVPDDSQYIAVRPAKILLLPEQISPLSSPITQRNLEIDNWNEEEKKYQTINAKNILLPSHTQTLLEELRTFHSSEYQDMLVFSDSQQDDKYQQVYIALFLMPNTVVVVKETYKGFIVEQKYQIRELGQVSNRVGQDYDINMYGIGQKQNQKYNALKQQQNDNKQKIGAREGLMTVSNSKQIFKVGIRNYKKYEIPKNGEINILFLVFLSENIFMTAEGENGISVYELPSQDEEKKGLKLIKSYSCEDLKIQSSNDEGMGTNCKITDLSLQQKNGKNILYIMDAKSGIIAYQYQLTDEQDFNAQKQQYITKINDCESFDFIPSNDGGNQQGNMFVLICSLQYPPYILEVVPFVDPDQDQLKYVQRAPKYHPCTFKDLIIGYDFYLAFDKYSIDVFWMGESEEDDKYVRQDVNFAGLQVFALHQQKRGADGVAKMKRKFGQVLQQDSFKSALKEDEEDLFMYVVEENILTKYKMQVFAGGVYAYSPYPLNKQITIKVPSKCPLPQNSAFTHIKPTQQRQKQCIYIKPVKMMIQNEPTIKQLKKQKISMSLGIILIMLIVLIILVWICIKKYNGLQEHARKLLNNYRSQAYNENKFTL